ncbi:MAG TPA: DUF924 family protein [Burkholderiales bacterium]|nr:DUF924 family protein [Burkholderiales bacterium]
MPDYREILDFWFGTGPERGKSHKRWFQKDAAFDAEIAARFTTLYELLAGGTAWLESAEPCLARIVVLDQFPRQIFRGQPRAFAADPLALQAAKLAVERGYDRGMRPVERVFVYLPFEHSESLADQERSVALYLPLKDIAETADTYRYAVAHRDIIARFGRFPHRNAILGRPSTAEEIEFLKTPGSSF